MSVIPQKIIVMPYAYESLLLKLLFIKVSFAIVEQRILLFVGTGTSPPI